MNLLTGDPGGAIAHLERVVDAFPDWIPSRLELGGALFKTRRFAEAAEQYKACLRIERHHEAARKALVEIEGAPR